jgi:hypothetical protein
MGRPPKLPKKFRRDASSWCARRVARSPMWPGRSGSAKVPCGTGSRPNPTQPNEDRTLRRGVHIAEAVDS